MSTISSTCCRNYRYREGVSYCRSKSFFTQWVGVSSTEVCKREEEAMSEVGACRCGCRTT